MGIFNRRKVSLKTVLCYGDSNTWGTVPGGGKFFRHECWVGVLQSKLGSLWRVIDDGLCGRTAGCDDHAEPGVERNGLKLFKTSLICHSPLDVCIIMLGTNDFKTPFYRSGMDVAADLAKMVVTAHGDYGYGPPPRVLLICPPGLTEDASTNGNFENGPAKSRDLRLSLMQMQDCLGEDTMLLFADDILYNGDKISGVGSDGIHLTRIGHKLLGEAVAVNLLQWK
jgi:lysophospholipase L1-like esterase